MPYFKPLHMSPRQMSESRGRGKESDAAARRASKLKPPSARPRAHAGAHIHTPSPSAPGDPSSRSELLLLLLLVLVLLASRDNPLSSLSLPGCLPHPLSLPPSLSSSPPSPFTLSHLLWSGHRLDVRCPPSHLGACRPVGLHHPSVFPDNISFENQT